MTTRFLRAYFYVSLTMPLGCTSTSGQPAASTPQSSRAEPASLEPRSATGKQTEAEQSPTPGAVVTAVAPSASLNYVSALRDRIQPIFCGQTLPAYHRQIPSESVPTGAHSNLVEIVVDRSGRIVRMGLVKSFGAAFDVPVLDAVARAAPFEPPPDALISPDGNVYINWEFCSDAQVACAPTFLGTVYHVSSQ